MSSSKFYRQEIPDINLSIERATQPTPDDGKYYVIKSGEIVAASRSLKQPKEAFKKIVDESGYSPEPAGEGRSTSQMMTERYMEAKDMYWANSYKHRGGGGRGGRGGI